MRANLNTGVIITLKCHVTNPVLFLLVTVITFSSWFSLKLHSSVYLPQDFKAKQEHRHYRGSATLSQHLFTSTHSVSERDMNATLVQNDKGHT